MKGMQGMAGKHILFYKYFEQWIEVFKAPEVSKVTLATYKNAAKQVKKLAPDLYLDEMTRMDYQQLINRYGKTHEIGTVKNFLHSCNAVLDDAYYDQDIQIDVRYKVKPVSSKAHKVTRQMVLEVDETERLEKVLQNTDEVTAKLADFILRTGVRIGEALGITPRDVDFNNMLVDINKSYRYKQNHDPDNMFGPTKNKFSIRQIDIDECAKKDLLACMKGVEDDEPIFVISLLKEHQKEYRKQQRSKVKTTKLKLQKELKRPASNVRLNNKLNRYCKKANVPRITIHNLRHTHASILIFNEISIQALADRLGHGSTETTQRTYVHLLKKMKKRDNKKMKKALSKL